MSQNFWPHHKQTELNQMKFTATSMVKKKRPVMALEFIKVLFGLCSHFIQLFICSLGMGDLNSGTFLFLHAPTNFLVLSFGVQVMKTYQKITCSLDNTKKLYRSWPKMKPLYCTCQHDIHNCIGTSKQFNAEEWAGMIDNLADWQPEEQ
jgi:hypothetical protein